MRGWRVIKWDAVLTLRRYGLPLLVSLVLYAGLLAVMCPFLLGASRISNEIGQFVVLPDIVSILCRLLADAAQKLANISVALAAVSIALEQYLSTAALQKINSIKPWQQYCARWLVVFGMAMVALFVQAGTAFALPAACTVAPGNLIHFPVPAIQTAAFANTAYWANPPLLAIEIGLAFILAACLVEKQMHRILLGAVFATTLVVARQVAKLYIVGAPPAALPAAQPMPLPMFLAVIAAEVLLCGVYIAVANILMQKRYSLL